VDAGTGTVRIRGRIDNQRIPPSNARLLYPGLFARVRVPSGLPTKYPAIPEDALMTGQEGRFVYVLDEKNVVQKRTVTVGPIVWKGLPPAKDAANTVWALKPLTTQTPAGKDDGKPAPPTFIPSMVAITSGLSEQDKVVINGLTKARPGLPVVPEMRELQPPAAAASK
jgi:multidrug efflux pump subunit AcrA (membrane-fusion protein)